MTKKLNLINILCITMIIIAILLMATPVFLYILIDRRAKCAEKYGNSYTYSLDLQKCIDFKGDSKSL